MENVINLIHNLMQISEFEILIKLILIVFLSGIVGYERESWNKPAGFRTHVLVGISAVLVVICGEASYEKTGADASRIPAQLLSGIGFLGAGTILRDGFSVKGLTTAAGLLAITCIGLAVGEGFYLGAIIATAVVYVVLSYSHFISDTLEHFNSFELKIITNKPKDKIEEIEKIMEKYEVEIKKLKIENKDENNYISLECKFREKLEVNKIISNLLKIDDIDEVIKVKES